MRLTVRSAFVAMSILASVSAAGAQSDPSLRTPPPAMGQNAPPPPVFASPPPVTVKDGFTYAVLGDISLVRPVTQLALPEFDKVLQIVRNADFALANQEGTAFHTATKRFAVNEVGAMAPSDSGAAWDIKNMGVRMVTVA